MTFDISILNGCFEILAPNYCWHHENDFLIPPSICYLDKQLLSRPPLHFFFFFFIFYLLFIFIFWDSRLNNHCQKLKPKEDMPTLGAGGVPHTGHTAHVRNCWFSLSNLHSKLSNQFCVHIWREKQEYIVLQFYCCLIALSLSHIVILFLES